MRALVLRLCSRLSECWRHLNVSHFSRLRSSSPTALPESERRRKTAELSNNRICVERFVDILRDSLRSLRLARRSKWRGELSLLARISLNRRTGALPPLQPSRHWSCAVLSQTGNPPAPSCPAHRKLASFGVRAKISCLQLPLLPS